MYWSIGSKTFFLGEYYVLSSGKGLIAATEKRFSLKAEPSDLWEIVGLPENSPADRLLRDGQQAMEQPFKLQFIDPYQGAGGLGASTAQFALLFAFLKNRQTSPFVFREASSELLKVYRSYVGASKGVSPSGADLIGQWYGGLTAVDTQSTQCDTLRWTFDHLDFLIVKTGNKLATHIHLESLKKSDFQIFESAYNMALMGLIEGDREEFVEGVSKYRALLESEGLTDQKTRELLKKWDECQLTLAHKGCGAMGVDTLVLFFDPVRFEEVLNQCQKMQLAVVGSSKDITSGICTDNECLQNTPIQDVESGVTL
ncbi:MAG: hypothetical protein KDD61_13650 [Bdellovibrionales bacterium]|nr:hypothetical protein [Bdellovibrionales bacterium]